MSRYKDERNRGHLGRFLGHNYEYEEDFGISEEFFPEEFPIATDKFRVMR